jgi:hypothetical protein
MKHLRNLAAVASVLALTSLSTASTTSATTLEVGGHAKNESLAIKASLKSGTSLLAADTFGFVANTCTGSTIEAKSEAPFTGTTVGGKASTLSFSPCKEGAVVTDEPGVISVEWIPGTTNGTGRLSGAKLTVPSVFGLLTCTTPAAGTDLGTLTGVASGNATIDINAVINCGSIDAKWTGTYTVTSPEGLGVIDRSTTTLEVGGVAKIESLAIKASLKSGTSLLATDTFGFFANTCTGSTIEANTEAPFTGTTVGGKVSTLSFSPCKEGAVTTDELGAISVEWILGTTNGTVRSSGAKLTVPSALGRLTCTTPAAGTDLGTLTGVASGNATIDINAVVNCGIDTKWTGTYTVTSPEGLGVTS